MENTEQESMKIELTAEDKELFNYYKEFMERIKEGKTFQNLLAEENKLSAEKCEK